MALMILTQPMVWMETSTSILQQIQSLVRRQEELGDLGLQLLGLREHRVLKGNKELRESRDRRVTWDLLALRVLKVIKGHRVHKAFKEKLGHRVRKVRKAIKGFRESRVYRERLVQRELME